MLSGIFDLFGGTSDKKSSYEEHVIPIPQHSGRPLTYADCFTWLDKKVPILLKRFDLPQIGTVKYIGSDEGGNLCAGMEFLNNVGGMSGKVCGQKLWKCKPGHGLLIPVQFVPDPNAQYQVPIPNPSTRSPNRAHNQPAINEFVPVNLPELKVGDNVVWLGGTSPQTGIVRWIGRAGSESVTIKAWVEMDDHVGFGLNEIDLGTKFGCTTGRGRFLAVDQLILLENFVSGENEHVEERRVEENNDPIPIVPSAVVENSAESINESSNIIATQVQRDLIDFTEENNLNVTEAGDSLADQYFRRLIIGENTEEAMDTTEPSLGENHDEFCPTPSAPPKTPDDGPPVWNIPPSASQAPSPEEADVNGNAQPTPHAPYAIAVKLYEKTSVKLVEDNDEDYLPPFIVPPIDISEFFRADGPKGIQGKRNSCYIDVVLFSMFAFTDHFDPFFLVKSSSLHSKVPDSALTKTARKLLGEQIVNPLRQNYCPAEGVNTFRELMIPFSDKLDGAFMDIEEFMLIMFDKLFRLKEFIRYDNGVGDYLHQVNLGDHNLPPVITLKQCLELSMKDYNLKLESVPSPALIIEIPRHHSGIIQSTTIVPNLSINLESFLKSTDNANFGHAVMNLVAVICINDFHFVTFVKCGKGPLSHWVLFDSNPSEERPKVEIVPKMGEWLESLEHQSLTNATKLVENRHNLAPHVQRLLSDIYVCIYCPNI